MGIVSTPLRPIELASFGADMILPGWLRQVAARAGDRAAVLGPDGHAITYADIDTLRRNLQVRLAELGLGPRDCVAVVMPVGQAAAAMVTATAASAACVPLNPAYVGRELRGAFTELDIRAVIADPTAEAAIATANDLGIPRLVPADLMCGKALAGAPILDPQGDDVALMLHTSGTTARPKIVALRHHTLLGTARKLIDWFRLTPDDRCLNLMPVYNAHGTGAALFAAIFSEGSIVCLPGFTTIAFFDALKSFEPSWYTGGATFNHAIASALEDAPALATRGRLRFLRSGSGPLSAGTRQTLERAFGVPMIESYAMTEVGLITVNPLDRRKPGTAGVPVVETIAVIDESGTPLPNGRSGQIIVRDPLVATHYENDPESSASSFKQGWLHTGDQGHFDEDGYLVVTGRIKEMISRGGDKISPVEVESILLTHPDVKECVVFGIPHDTLGEEVGAAVVLRNGGSPSVEELRRHAGKSLAAYKVPRTIRIVGSIPKTAVGKIARLEMHHRLAIEADSSSPARSHTPLEAALAGLWSSLLKRQPIAPDQDFFLIGGDSLLATRLLNSIEDVFGVALPVRSLFEEGATIAGMAALIEKARESGSLQRGRGNAAATQPAGAAASLSFGQLRLWFLHQLDPRSAEYNVPWALRCRGALDREALGRALSALAERHHALRTRFVVEDGDPRQVVDSAVPLPLTFHDLSGLDDGRRSAELERLSSLQVREPFDLTRTPLLRTMLIRQATDDHVLLVTIHHIIFDRWSMAVFRDELAELYGAVRESRAPILPVLAMQYPAYAAWQRAAYGGSQLAPQIGYWLQKLSNVPSDLSLPFDRPRPTARSHAGGRERATFDATLIRSLRALARQSDATLFMTLLAGFQALLSRYTGQTDFVVGSPVAGRRRSEVEPLIGFFVNTLALRADVSGDPTFQELIGRVRETALGAFAHQDVPFERLIEELKPERHANRPPLVQVMFALQNVPTTARPIAGLTAEPYELDNEASKFDLIITAVEQGDALEVSFSYDRGLFDAEAIQRFARHYRNVLASAVHDPAAKVSALSVLAEDELREITVEWNRTSRPFPGSERIESLFAAQARRHPRRPALAGDDLRLSYAELDAISDFWAGALLRNGVREGDIVGLCMERSGALVVAMLAILKAGCAYLPLDPTQPRHRLDQIVQNAAPALFICDADANRATRAIAEKCLVVGNELPLTPPETMAQTPRDGGSNDAACVLFTSGSTGQPKGVVVPHQAIARLVINTNFVDFGPDDIVAQGAHASFDAALLEIWGALLNGACVTVIPRDVLLSPAALRDCLQTQHVSVLFLTTALFNQIAVRNPDTFAPLRCLMFGGEPADPTAIRSVLGSGFKGALLNAYGPTEATTFATTFDARMLPAQATRVPVGRPIANTLLYILDARHRPVPIGVPGEVFIGGPGLAIGYLNDPGLTAERFVVCEIEPGSPMRLYRTGDLARYLGDGTIEVLGRMDGQVKIRGHRVEPAEVETVLRHHPAIREAAVVGRSHAGEAWLAAYLVGAEPAPDSNVRAFLARAVPDYMVPRAFIWMDALPLGPTGKVDRRALPDASTAGAIGAESRHIPPRTLLENQLAAIWEDLLGRSSIGITDNFFELGGHSLLAVRMLGEIERLCGRALPVSTLFEGATIAQLALAIRSRPPAASASLLLDLKRDGSRAPFFFLHGDYVSGGFYCRKIADQLDPDQPMIALLPHGIDGTPVPPTIEAMAEAYIELIRERQPDGPYRLGGTCNGGLIAYEIARQLRARGETVDMLIMIEPPDWNLPWLVSGAYAIETVLRSARWSSAWQVREVIYALRPRMHYYRRRMKAFGAASPREKLRIVTRKFVRRQQANRQLAYAEPPTAASVEGAVPELDQLPDLYVDAVKRYRPGIYDGPVVYVASEEELERGSINPKLWHRVTDDLTICVLPGNHQSIATRHVAALTHTVDRCLRSLNR